MRTRRPLRFRPRPALDTLETRAMLSAAADSAAPSISLSDVVTVPAGKTIQIPIAGDAAGGGALTYSIAGGTKVGLQSSFHPADNPWLDLYTNLGSLRFQLLADVAPQTVRHISGLVSSGFYDGLTFHHIVNVNGFRYAQGGDPRGDGTGGPEFHFDDEFNPDAIFSGSGQLATANVSADGSGKDQNGSQFIVTASPARSLDFNHTIFGQLVRGGKALSAIVNADTVDYAPTDSIRIKQAQLVEDGSDAVLQVKAPDKPSRSTLTVTAEDSAGHAVTRTIQVRVVSDADLYANDPPILQPIAPIAAQPGQTLVIPVKALDLEGDDYDIGGDYTGNELTSTAIDQTNKTITVTLADNAKGPIDLIVGVKGASAISRGGINLPPGSDPRTLASGLFDTQKVTIAVGDVAIRQAVPAEDEFVALPAGGLDNTLLATFKAPNGAQPGDFTAQLDWGDGQVSGSSVRAMGDGEFAVFGSHQYDTSGIRPITVNLVADNGAAAEVLTQIRVAPPVELVGQTLMITGTQDDDAYTIRRDEDGNIVVQPGDLRWPADDVNRIEARLYGGNDSFDANIDQLPNCYVDAGNGNDTVQGGPGDDTLIGGAGDDQIGGESGNDLIRCGDGNDTVLGGSGKNVIYGDDGDDRLIGSNGRDLVYGGDGNDRLYGRGGDDTLDGGGGVDRLYGEAGHDLLIGGSGNDRLYGGIGDDTLFGKAGNDLLSDGPGRNRNPDVEDGEIVI